jgi:hypothetical protein
VKVTLAYPYKRHKPDDTVSLPDDEARRLLSDGLARLPAKPAVNTTAEKPTPTIRPRHNSGASRTKEK